MVIRAQLAGSESMRVSKMGRAPGTAQTCPVCRSDAGEFCRQVISAGSTPMRLGGYVIEVHPERVQEVLLPRQTRTDRAT